MEKVSDTIEQLKTRAREFRLRADACGMPKYAALMRKGADDLDEHALRLQEREEQMSEAPALVAGTEEGVSCS